MRRLRGVWLGRKSYGPVHELQHELREARKEGRAPDTVLFVEHEPVVTMGRGSKAGHVLFGREALRERGVELFEVGRGGDVTLHAPGQLVCYPIVDLSPDRCDVRRYVQDLTETMRRLAAHYGVAAGPIDKYIGLWVDRESPREFPGSEALRDPVKLGAIGVSISRWVTMHGFALNLTTDLDLFRLIVPCGIGEYGVTSIRALTGRQPDVLEAAELAFRIFADVIGAEIEGELESEPARHDQHVGERRAL